MGNKIRMQSVIDIISKYPLVVCYGAGSKGIQAVHILEKYGIRPNYFVDNNPRKWNTKLERIPIISYKELKEKEQDYIILLTCVYANAIEISKQLINEGEKNRIIHFANPFKVEEKLLNVDEIPDFEQICNYNLNMLEDDKSRQIFCDFLKWKMTGNQTYTYKYTEGDWREFFSSGLILPERYSYIDIGAYTGDTILRFLTLNGGKCNKIIAFEPDINNYNSLKNMISEMRLEELEIECHKEGVWSNNGYLNFYSSNDGKVYESSNFFVDTRKIITTKRAGQGIEEKIVVHCLDYYKYKKKDMGQTIIKIDALASEYEILLGAKQTIRELHPVLIMELGTYSKHIFDMIPYIYRLDNSYKFYLRQMKTFNNSRTILYAL